MKKIFALLLAAAMVLGMTACAGGSGGSAGGDLQDYDALSQAIYEEALGEFHTAYQAALAAETVSKRYALMAVAEAKLLGSAVMLPLTASGGNYAISRLAPYTVPTVLWGNDSDRFHNGLVTTSPITAAHRDEMKAKWAELKGTGTYESWARDYLKKKGYTLKNSYTISYSSDPKIWDVLATAKASDSEAIVNTYDGLYEYDSEGVLQPALAQRYEVVHNTDGTVSYVFTLKSGLKWVDSQGRVVADVKADDFVAGMQHLLDAGTGPVYLIQDVIVNAADYITGELTDFSQVGVQAPDDTTLIYTLTGDISYFMTMLGYSVFAPMSREYYTSQGGKFGGEFDASAESYTYGKTPDHIAYCGPYLVTNNTAENTIVFRANPAYWNADGINISTITWLYNDGKDVLKAYTDTMSGTIDGTGLNSSSVAKAKSDGVFDTLGYIAPNEATTYVAFHNLNRQALSNFNDSTVAVTPKTQEQLQRTAAAMGNVHFRRAIAFATDRGAYNAQSVGEDLKLTSLRNTYTPGSFVSLTEPVVLELGGTETTYPAGTAYGQILQDQLDADGVNIAVWDSEADAGIGSSDGFDGWYDPENARQELSAAVSELAQQGIVISADNPVYIDFPYFSGSEVNTNRANAYKQSVETALQGAVRVNLIACTDRADVLYAGFYASIGSEANYDVYDTAGWGPDYGDPQTYLDTLLPDYAGDMTRMMGIF